MMSWDLQPEQARAEHDSGLIVRYKRLPMTPEEEEEQIDDAQLGECSTTDGRVWSIVTTPALLYAVIDIMFSRYGKDEAPTMMKKLACEAGQLWIEHQVAMH